MAAGGQESYKLDLVGGAGVRGFKLIAEPLSPARLQTQGLLFFCEYFFCSRDVDF